MPGHTFRTKKQLFLPILILDQIT